jgi:aldose sugar dehydrogenase
MQKYRPYLFQVFAILSVVISCNKKEESNCLPPNEPNWPTTDIRTVKSGLNFPWDILWGKDNYIWMSERNGKISKIDPLDGTTVFSQTITEVVSNGEGGLLGMVQHPEFTTNGFFFVVYNYNSNGNYREKVVRYTFNNNTLTNPITILDNIPSANIHNGSRLVISNEATPKLYISTGDAASISLVQDPASKAGKILRINLDGTIPADNPVAGNPYWSFGHRNPQGLVLANNILYSSEHGPNIEDEINIIEKGRNYGWPDVKGPCNDPSEIIFCNEKNVRVPIWSSGNVTIATCGLDYYNADLIPQWKNSLLLVTLKDATLYQLQLSANGQTITGGKQYFRSSWGRLRDVCVSPAGRVYLCTSNGSDNDKLIEIQKPE